MIEADYIAGIHQAEADARAEELIRKGVMREFLLGPDRKDIPEKKKADIRLTDEFIEDIESVYALRGTDSNKVDLLVPRGSGDRHPFLHISANPYSIYGFQYSRGLNLRGPKPVTGFIETIDSLILPSPDFEIRFDRIVTGGLNTFIENTRGRADDRALISEYRIARGQLFAAVEYMQLYDLSTQMIPINDERF
jgi:hypothetical protein